MSSSSPSTDTLPQTPTRRQSAPAAGSSYFTTQRRASTPTGGRPLSAILERAPTMVPIEEEPVPVVVDPPKSSTLHHLPIAFALLPAAAGLIVGGGEKWTDVMLLGLAGVYLNWLVKCNLSFRLQMLIIVPWEWYHSSRTLRLLSDSQQSPMPLYTHIDPSTPVGEGQSTSAIASEDEDESPTPRRRETPPPLNIIDPEVEAATTNLRRTELLALASCFLSPLLGGYLLHYIREFLSRPSEGVVSTFNITLFVMAAELRPAMKLMEMIKQRSLHLQKIVHKETLEAKQNISSASEDVEPLKERISHLESMIDDLRVSVLRVQGGREEVVTGVREGVRGEVEALNRISSPSETNIGAVRRYEKNFALHRAHTEDRINLLNSRLNDLSLVVSDTNQPPLTLLGFILAIPGASVHLIQDMIELPGVIFKRVIRIILLGGGGGRVAKSNGKVEANNKGKATNKGTRSPSKKRVA